MKKLMIFLFMTSIAVVNSVAQEKEQNPPPKRTPEERATKMTEHLVKELTLSAEQQQKIKALILKREQERDALQDKMQANRKQAEQEMEADMQKILNAEQFEKFKKKREEMKKKRMEDRKEGKMPPDDPEGPPPPPEGK